jgi:hypothetical protein
LPLLSRTLACSSRRQRTFKIHCSRRVSVAWPTSAGHYFSLRSLLTRKPAPERDSGFPFRLSLPTVAPGPFAGALRFVSLALHILPHKGERRRRNVLARKVSDHFSTRKRASLQLNCPSSTHTAAENPQHTASLDELAEPDYYNNCAETSSTRLFASHLRILRIGQLLIRSCACLPDSGSTL